jgi:hypothetical protein
MKQTSTLHFALIEKSSALVPPEVYITLKMNQHIHITPKCMSLREINIFVDTLIEELEIIRDQAKQFFKHQSLT